MRISLQAGTTDDDLSFKVQVSPNAHLSGVKNADENELRSIASDPDTIHMYNVNDFQFMVDIVDDLTLNLCNSVKGSGRRTFLSAPELQRFLEQLKDRTSC